MTAARNDAQLRQHEAELARGEEAAARKLAEDSAAESEAVSGFLVDVFGAADRSEEHTSELQSQFHLVCRLLLEKKKKKRKTAKNKKKQTKHNTQNATHTT